MNRVLGALCVIGVFSLSALAADPKPAAKPAEAKSAEAKPEPKPDCEYKTCANPSLQGGGLKDSSQLVGEAKTRGAFSSICQIPHTPVNSAFWCVIGPGPVGVPCYCNYTDAMNRTFVYWGMTVQ